MKKQRLQVEPAYENAHLVAQDLLAHINELLQDMPAPGTDGVRIDWSNVGTITRVNDLLSRVVAHLEGGQAHDD